MVFHYLKFIFHVIPLSNRPEHGFWSPGSLLDHTCRYAYCLTCVIRHDVTAYNLSLCPIHNRLKYPAEFAFTDGAGNRCKRLSGQAVDHPSEYQKMAGPGLPAERINQARLSEMPRLCRGDDCRCRAD